MTYDQFKEISTYLNKISIFVIDSSYAKTDYIPLDLSTSNIELEKVDVSNSVDLSQYIDEVIAKKNGKLAFGGYLEKRAIYKRSTHFNQKVDPLDERDIHLGIDIWAKQGTDVLSVLDGKVHSFNNNLNFGDYGPTIILEHEVESLKFYTLYGHLSTPSLDKIESGQFFKQGSKIAELGVPSENGDYPAHLHFQVILDIENYKGDYPGVTSMNSLNFYKKNCPDPNFLLGI